MSCVPRVSQGEGSLQWAQYFPLLMPSKGDEQVGIDGRQIQNLQPWYLRTLQLWTPPSVLVCQFQLCWSKFKDSIKVTMDPHFSSALPLDQRDSLFYLWKINFGKSRSCHLFYFYFKGKIKQERKTFKCDSIIFGKNMSLKNPSLSPGIRLFTRKVPIRGSTPLRPKEVSTD